MRLTFLAADMPLSKSYGRDAQGRLIKKSYPSAYHFTSHDLEIKTLSEFAAACADHAARGHCLLKGTVQRPLVYESRAGSTDANAPTDWICIDIDRFPGAKTADDVAELLGLAHTDYVLQYSSAYGIEEDRGLTCHLMFALREPALPSALKLWLKWKNLTVPALTENLQLTKTNHALSWPLDITTCQSDKLIYIAPPALDNVEAPEVERIQAVVRGSQYAILRLDAMPTAAQIQELEHAKINELRQAKGLGSRRFTFKTEKSTGLEVLAKADAATLTGLKQERGFTYFNLNGGDSWGYWHSDEHPEVIRNFKGEPDYLTKDLLPEYWATIVKERKENDIAQKVEAKEQREAIQSGTPVENAQARVLVFRDFSTGAYYNGTWDPASETLTLAQAKSETQIQHFLKERGLPEIDFIPIWNLVFDLQSDVRVDFATKTVNLFKPSPYMQLAPAPRTVADFPTIDALITHCYSDAPEERDYLYNWYACIFQFRDRTLTAQIFHGVQGTGKGLLVHNVLTPLLGTDLVVVKRMEELEDTFNSFLERKLLVCIDEAQISDSKKSKMIMANIKSQITEPWISVRKMRTEAQTVRNHTNWMFLSNMPDPVMIDQTDRRFSVGQFRREMLVPDDAFVERLEQELPAFAEFLASYPADRNRARTVQITEERNRIIQTSRTSAELVTEALQKGMLEAFWEELPTGATDLLPVTQQLLLTEYQNLVHAAVMENKRKFTRDELRVLFEYLCGDMPRTPTKFTQFLRHRNLNLKNIRVGERVMRGLEVDWQVSDEWLAARRAELSLTPRIKERIAA